jgi:NADH dehydrogenase
MAAFKKVLIIGGGFGGVKAALELADHRAFEVTLLSDQENFRYYPTLYNIAVGKSRLGASIPLSEIFEGKKVKIIHAKAVAIDREHRAVKDSAGHNHHYDDLIVALGVVTNFFGIKGLKENSYGIKTLEEAQELRNHLHKQLVDDKKPDVNYVVIGGGPTGVELAGALPGYIHHIMKMHGLRDRKIHVDLIESAPRLMPRMPKSYSRAVQRHLRDLGVKLYLNKTVQGQDSDSLTVNDHEINSHTVVWTAGVTNHPFLKENGFRLNDRGKAIVNRYLEAEPRIHIIGDNADTPYSGMAQTALYDGRFVAQNLKRHVEGKPMRIYKPRKPVYVTPAGPGWAAVLWGKFHTYGFLGWGLREAADFLGYHDYEPWWKSSKHYMAKDDEEESCPECK